MREDLLTIITKVLDSPDISKGTKDDVVRHYMLPKADATGTPLIKAPIEKDEGRVGAVRRPDKQTIDLKNDPRRKAENEAMSETLSGLPLDE